VEIFVQKTCMANCAHKWLRIAVNAFVVPECGTAIETRLAYLEGGGEE